MRSVVISFLVLLTSSVASAGHKQNDLVTVTATEFSGQIGSARASADSKQYIGCSIEGDAGASQATYFCAGSDSTGTTKFCFGTDPLITQVIASMTSSSYIRVVLAADGSCGNVVIHSFSYNRPSTP